MKPLLLLLSLVIFSSQIFAKTNVPLVDNNFNATLWVQQSAEYLANSLQSYQTAASELDAALGDKSYSAALEQTQGFENLPPAIVLDLDETVFDNSYYQANLITNHQHWTPKSWDKWVTMRAAGAVPGAIDFLHLAISKKIKIIFISNRACSKRLNLSDPCPQKLDTIKNLASIGLKQVQPEQILLKHDPLNTSSKDWGSEKQSRRQFVSQTYRIIMMFGDDLGDFLAHVKKNTSPLLRANLVKKNSHKWGRQWFTLTNPTYGSWLNILKKPKSQYLKNYHSIEKKL